MEKEARGTWRIEEQEVQNGARIVLESVRRRLLFGGERLDGRKPLGESVRGVAGVEKGNESETNLTD